ncbi:hypothetical protein JG687_00011730 [Phytophthora cactorum]|uniref:Uncharacterized protein n=1 Tax=Phytophthora cactorum TaxID=29920 RepID=A0A8T1U525_9STRA|nr:hypothetical protein JG687_00011730 [Phytophthora cactorum]
MRICWAQLIDGLSSPSRWREFDQNGSFLQLPLRTSRRQVGQRWLHHKITFTIEKWAGEGVESWSGSCGLRSQVEVVRRFEVCNGLWSEEDAAERVGAMAVRRECVAGVRDKSVMFDSKPKSKLSSAPQKKRSRTSEKLQATESARQAFGSRLSYRS